jgi:glycosyltransferase involved in cell wall biosynthesis
MIVGDGLQRDALKAIGRDLGVSENIEFVGAVPHEDIPSHLSKADVYVSTSLSDGASISLFEAMSCGLPLVVSDIPANRPWVIDGQNGFLFPVKDHEALARSLVQILKDSEMKQRFGKANRALVLERANHRKEMARVEKMYESLVSGRNAG